MLKRTKNIRIMKWTKMSLSCWFWKENIRECFSCKLHLLRKGQLHHCDQKIAFLFLDLKSGKELIFFSVSLQTDIVQKLKKTKQIHTSFSGLGEKLSKNIEHFASPFFRVKRFHSYQKATLIVFNFLVFLLFLNTFAVKTTSIFSRINLQIIVNVVRGSVKKNCQKFPQFLCFSFSLYKMDAWLIIPLMIIVHH